MATTVHEELAYDAPLDAVSAMLADPAFREQVLERQRVLRGDVSVDGGTVRIEQVQSARGIPAFATKFVGDEITIVQEEEWATPDRAAITVTIPGKPGDMTGSAMLAEAGAGTVETVDLTIRVGIPLVGGKIEKLIADILAKALRKEHEVGVEWLAR
jgi:hypothetical protein